MIPSDLAARLRMMTEASFFDSEPPVQGTAKIREIQARLPQLLPGQQFTATINRPLPDGTFQAVVAGREMTLALNQAAKSGDTLELVVTKTTPKAVFAQVATPNAAVVSDAANSRPTLSQTGQLISFLLTGQPAPRPVQLANGGPLLPAPPATTSPSPAGSTPPAPALAGATSPNAAPASAAPAAAASPAAPGAVSTAAMTAGAQATIAAAASSPALSQAGLTTPQPMVSAPPPSPNAIASGVSTPPPGGGSIAANNALHALQPAPPATAPTMTGVAGQQTQAVSQPQPRVLTQALAGAIAGQPVASADAGREDARATLAQQASGASGVTPLPRRATVSLGPALDMAQLNALARTGPGGNSLTAAVLAPLLRQALSQSGLFYESHQLQWLSGKQDAASLFREPQGQFSTPRGSTGPTSGAPAQSSPSTPASSGVAAPAGGSSASAIARMGGNQAAVTAINESTEVDGRSARLSDSMREAMQVRQTAIPDRLVPIVHQQLDSMATQQYLLAGQAWPGQTFEWEIIDPEREGQGQGDEQADAWNTTLRLTMPRLGSVEACIQLTPAGVALRLFADEAASASLEEASGELESALEAAGLALTGFVVERRVDE